MRTLLVHGFTQTARSWDPVRAHLPAAVDREVTALEVPDGLDWDATVAALADAGGRGHWVGYSMGGRLALAVALTRPDLVDSLVLVSAASGIGDPTARSERVAADEHLAAEVERDGLESFLTRWLAQPLFATLPPDAAGLADRRTGNTVARVTHQLRALGQGAQPDYSGRLAEIGARGVPVLLVTGALDAKYRDRAADLAAAIGPTARHVTVADAGHAVHLERPVEVAALLVGHVT